MVGALQGLPVPVTRSGRVLISRLLEDDRATVSTHVHERVEAFGRIANDDHRDMPGTTREVVSRLGDLAGETGELPPVTEEALLLDASEVGIDIPAARDRVISHRIRQLEEFGGGWVSIGGNENLILSGRNS